MANARTSTKERNGGLEGEEAAGEGNPLLEGFGERLRNLRARRGLTRKALAQSADVSERYLALLENGTGNPSLVILDQVSRALECSMAELVGDATATSAEWLLIRELLDGRSEAELRRARIAVGEAIGLAQPRAQDKDRRIALIGLRGAGKSTLGRMLADTLDVPFIELSAQIEKVAGYSIREIHDLYGTSSYRRYERRALEEVVQIYEDVVIAAPGGIVSEPATFNLLLTHCFTVWLQADAEDHMARVAAQGDMRPMAASAEAMDDLRRILAGRSAFYAKADLALDTSRQPLDETFRLLLAEVEQRCGAGRRVAAS